MTAPKVEDIELRRELQEFIRFMIRDHAFSDEFLVTAVQEYYQRNGLDPEDNSAWRGQGKEKPSG